MHALLAASLAALSLNPPVLPDEAAAVAPARALPHRPAKLAGQGLAGAGLGLAAGLATAIPAFAIAMCDSGSCGDEGLGTALAIATPVAFAAGEAAGVYLVGRAVDRETSGSFKRTLLGAVVGTGAGLAVWLGAGEGGTTASFVGGVTVATAATVTAYEFSRRKPGHARGPRLTLTPTVDAGGAGRGAGGGLRLAVSF